MFWDSDILQVTWVMNTNRATNEGFQAEFLNNGIHPLVQYITDLFHHVVCLGFPPTWSHYTIHFIHKSGSSADLNHYRTIMVGNTLSKLYATTLHWILSKRIYEGLLQAKV